MNTRPLHVLVLEGAPGAADNAIDELAGAGHTVSRCLASGAPDLPCNALAAGQACPLDGTAVNVALDVRARAPMKTASRA